LRRALLVVAAMAAVVWGLAPSPVTAAELVMFEAQACEWCEAWDREVGVVYGKTSEGERAPLRRVDIHAPRPPDLAAVAGVRFTPTFVLFDRGRELGRILGYAGEDHFWGLLGVVMRRLEVTPRMADALGEDWK
jgi:hypothetical protein